MDLIQIAFKDNGITVVCLDSTMTRTQRNRGIDDFEESPEISVILISIIVGGLGYLTPTIIIILPSRWQAPLYRLNLIAACMAHITEPQPNPASESQAIDSIHYLGQTRPITTTRYIMHDFFEMKIAEL